VTLNAERRQGDDGPSRYRWWAEPEGRAGGALTIAAANIEKWNWARRYLNLTCMRYMTGRELSAVYSYSMARRPGNLVRTYSAAEWKAPSFNVIATCADVYSARVWKNRPFIQVIPIAGDFKARVRSKKLSRFADAVFDETKFWPQVEMAGIDCMTTGDAFFKVREGIGADGGKIAIDRILADEILVNEEEAQYGNPRSMIQRVFMHREELYYKYGRSKEEKNAIERAPSAYPGFYYGSDLNYRDIVPLVEGWRLPGADKSTEDGRKLLSVGDCTLDDRKYKKHGFPFARLQFKPMSVGYFGQGLAEQLLPIQAEINRIDDGIWESMRRMAWPRVVVDTNSKVNENSLAGKAGGIVKWTSGGSAQAPEFVTPAIMAPEIYQNRDQWIQKGFKRARISESAASGEKPQGLNSGAAIMAWSTLDDSAHADLGQRLEDCVTDVANLVFDLAEDVKPRVRVPGRTVQEIDWDDAKMARNAYASRAFPMSRLPQLPAARLQQVADWYADGIIDKSTKLRLEQVPDTEGYADLFTAAEDNVHMCVDKIIEEGSEGYEPPEPYQDLKRAIQIGQSRWLQERDRDTPQDRLDLLLTWIMQCQELMEQGNPPPAIGIQAPELPPGVAPAAGAGPANGVPRGAPGAAQPTPAQMAPPA
jgi:hypothetical protein